MSYLKAALAVILPQVDFGNSVAEHDEILKFARVNTSVFTDLMEDRVDLIPGTKGSGKSALFRIFTELLDDYLLSSKRTAVAHGVYSHGDTVFLAFKDVFDRLTEDQFVDFWCIYFIKIAHKDFIQNTRAQPFFSACRSEFAEFDRKCHEAGIPLNNPHRSFRELLESTLSVAVKYIQGIKFNPVDGSFEFTPARNLGLPAPGIRNDRQGSLPRYTDQIKIILDEILKKSNLRLWLMIDRLDEIFPRRSQVETRALRGLLRAARVFGTRRISVKLFLRDDILSQVTGGALGFTALTHITSRQADKLRWNEDQVLTLIVNRLAASEKLKSFLKINSKTLESDENYREEVFYQVFPRFMESTIPTLNWIYERTMDGQGVVTPRDIIDLLTRAKQSQQDKFMKNSEGNSDWIIGPEAIQYGFEELGRLTFALHTPHES